MSRGRSPSVLLVVVALAVAAAGGWWLLKDGRSEEGPLPVPGVDGDLPKMSPAMGAPQAERPADAPREAVAAEGDRRIPVPEDWSPALRVKVPEVPESLVVTGEKLRDALLATPNLYVRWSSDAVRDAFLKANLRLPPEIVLPRGEPRGAPIMTIVGSIAAAGFSAELDPPVLKISEGNPDRSAQPPLPPPVQPPR